MPRLSPESEAESDGPDPRWRLGFLEEVDDPADLLRHRFRSKVGGAPAWLDPVNLPPSDVVTCSITQQPYRFLLQVYCPPDDDANEGAFHRVLYVFVSPAGPNLSQAGAVRVLRCQLPRLNPYYLPRPATDAEVAPPPLSAADESASLARDPWRVVEFERRVGAGDASATTTSSVTPAPMTFREWELDQEAESEFGLSDEEAALQGAAAGAQQGTGFSEADLPTAAVDDLESGIDPAQAHYAGFSARISVAPEQVLRYCRESGAEPLWPMAHPVPSPSDIPPCGCCGGPRSFELQIMPQLINFLAPEGEDQDALDYGTIAVYTCTQCCAPPEGSASAYMEEYAFVQTME